MKLSQWHYGNIKPVHVGVYKIKREDNKRKIMFSFFDGEYWHGWVYPHQFKIGYYPDKEHFIIAVQNRQWRGIVKDKK